MGLFGNKKSTNSRKARPKKSTKVSLNDLANREIEDQRKSKLKKNTKEPAKTEKVTRNDALGVTKAKDTGATKSLSQYDEATIQRFHAEYDKINAIASQRFSHWVQGTVMGTVEGAREKLIDQLTNSTYFKSTVLYHERNLAVAFVDEMVGIGLIPEILEKYPLTTDINFNSRFLTVDTGDDNIGKIVYAYVERRDTPFTEAEKAKMKPITDDYIKKLISTFSIREKTDNFSENNPIFNGFSDYIRISATHESLSSVGTTMSLRVSRPRLALTANNFKYMAPNAVKNLLFSIVKANLSIVINGETGTGKTELMKFLVTPIPLDDRIYMIEDVAETQLPKLFPRKDIYPLMTRTTENYVEHRTEGYDIDALVKQALRNFPRWIMVSETRGSEAFQLYQAWLNGHAVMTTVHAADNQGVPDRFITASSLTYTINNEDTMRENLLRYMGIGVHIEAKKLSNGRKIRYISEIASFNPELNNTSKHGTDILFSQTIRQDGDEFVRSVIMNEIPDHLATKLSDKLNWFNGELDKMWQPTTEPFVTREPISREEVVSLTEVNKRLSEEDQ